MVSRSCIPVVFTSYPPPRYCRFAVAPHRYSQAAHHLVLPCTPRRWSSRERQSLLCVCLCLSVCCVCVSIYARRMGQPTQRATNYTARSNIVTAQIFLHANGQRPNRAMIRQRSRRRQRRGEPHTEHGLGVLLASLNTFHTHTAASMKRDRRKSL